MKQSNRILWSGIGLVFFGILITLAVFTSLGKNSSAQNWLSKNNGYHGTSQTIHGDGNIISKTLNVSAFNKISASGNYKITLLSGATPHVLIKGDSNLQPHIKVDVTKDGLEVSTERGFNLSPTRVIEIAITTPELFTINLAGDTQLSGLNINTPKLDISLAGNSQATFNGQITRSTFNLGGNSNLNLTVNHNKSLEINSGGESKIKLQGSSEDITINNGGEVDVQAMDFSAKNVTINGAGETRVNINATDTITLNTLGHATLQYSGSPKVVNHAVGKVEITKF